MGHERVKDVVEPLGMSLPNAQKQSVDELIPETSHRPDLRRNDAHQSIANMRF
jgi:hypothetical protein